MRLLFKFGVSIHTAIYRLSGGRVGASIGGMRMLILTTRGRRSGKARSVPLGYILDGDAYVVIASYGGRYPRPKGHDEPTSRASTRRSNPNPTEAACGGRR